MSNETRTMMVVLVVCAFFVLGCIAIPVGVGAVLFFRLSRQAEVAQTEAMRAEAAVRQAMERDQAEMARMQAEMKPIDPTAIPGMPSLPVPPGPNLAPPVGIPPRLPGIDINNVDQRKLIYQGLKVSRQVSQLLEQGLIAGAAGADDANLKQAIAEMKKAQDQQLEEVCKSYGITRKQLDEIVAQGDKEGW
jgi:uncharacterized membrane protein